MSLLSLYENALVCEILKYLSIDLYVNCKCDDEDDDGGMGQKQSCAWK